jgi:TonB-dependent starch-binding outer membrane protein SusC
LEISFVGHETQVLSVKGKSVFMVALGQRQSILDETVVIAYGTTTKRFNTGNVSSVKASDIEKQPVNNPLLAMQGRVPGLFITQNTGLPGGGITVRIQGQNSILNGSNPLYIIDGVPYPSELPGVSFGPLGNSGGVANGSNTGTGNALSYINPSDIESIEILKDADATAIYGSRAANGAILITTKKGKAGQPKFDLNIQNGWGKVSRRLQMLNTEQYFEMRREAKINDNAQVLSTDYDINGLWDSTQYTDWQKKLIGETAQYTNVNASVSGGSSTIQYLVSGNYQKEMSVFPGNFSDRKSSMHIDINGNSLSRKFNFQISGIYLVDNNELPNTDLTSSAIRLEPNAPSLYNSDGTLNWMPDATGTSSWSNPLAIAKYRTYQRKANNILGNAMLSYRILPGLDFRSTFGYSNLRSNDLQLNPLLAIKPEARLNSSRTAYYGNRNVDSWIIEPQMTYKKSLGVVKLDMLLGTTFQESSTDGQLLYGSGHNSDVVLKDIRSAATVTAASSFSTIYKYNAIFGRANLNLLDKYIINLSARRDGSSRFGPESRFNSFGSVGVAWLFSEERLLNKNVSFLSFGKIRGSYGITGSDQLADYSFMTLYDNVTTEVSYQGSVGVFPSGHSNPNLHWEETKKIQIGLDLGFIKDRVMLNASYNRNLSSNQLLSYALPSITGNDGIYQNFPAKIRNINWEVVLLTSNIKMVNFSWNTSVNITIPENQLRNFPNLETSSYASVLIVGQPLGIIKAYHFLGVDPATGRYVVADKEGNATFSPTSSDRTVLINTLPKFYGGFQNNFRFKGIEVDFLFQFVKQIGSNVFFNNGASSSIVPGRFSSGNSNQPVTVLNRWKNQGDITNIQRYNSNGNLTASNPLASDGRYTDASYIRLKNVSLSWQLPNILKKKMHIQSCRIFAAGQNLLTITEYQGMDPENQSLNSLPPLRMITLGAQFVL